MIKLFEVVMCIECKEIIENRETKNYEESSYMCNEQMPKREIELATWLKKIKPNLGVCDLCASENELIVKGVNFLF